jgi:ribosome-associated protein
MAPPTRPPGPEPDPDRDPEGLEGEDEDERYVSRNRLRDQARAYLDLAEVLAKGKYTHLPDPPFDAELRTAIADAQRFEKNARSRQIRRVAQLLRGAGEMPDILDALAGKTPAMRAQQALERRCEDWRARLIAEGDPALSQLCDDHPHIDRQRLRQLARQARRTPPDARSKRAATALIREIRPLLVAAAAAEAEAAALAEAEAAALAEAGPGPAQAASEPAAPDLASAAPAGQEPGPESSQDSGPESSHDPDA